MTRDIRDSGYDVVPFAGLHGTRLDVLVCLRCGAVVYDRTRHDLFHDEGDLLSEEVDRG